MLIEAKAGERRVSNGALSDLRSGPNAELIVSHAGFGRFFETTRADRVFYLHNQAQTMAATHNTPLAAATGTPIVGIHNPASSGVAAVILYGWFASVSGTPAAQAHPVWNVVANATGITTNPGGSIVPGLAKSTTTSSVEAYNNVALTGLNTATGNLLAVRPFGVDTFAGAQAANAHNGSRDDVEGAIIVPPNAICGIFAGTGAGTTWVVSAGMAWAEIEWPIS